MLFELELYLFCNLEKNGVFFWGGGGRRFIIKTLNRDKISNFPLRGRLQ